MTSSRRDFFALAASGAAGFAAAEVGEAGEPVAEQSAGGAAFNVTVAANNAPASMKAAADYVCNGTNDQGTINTAINSLQPLGGVVALSPGNFNCQGPIKLRKRTSLIGSGRATRVVAKAGGFGGVVTSVANNQDKMEVAHLAIIGEGNDVNGIFWNITSGAGFDEGTKDAANRIGDVYISNVTRSGVYIAGGNNRAIAVQRVRVLNAGLHGFNLNSPDGFYSQCEAGSSGQAGFRIANANNRFTNCKAWFSDLSGFLVVGNRNQFSACESQDNERHGFEIRLGQNSFSACHADSNSWNSQNNVSAYDGFFVAPNVAWLQLIGCQAYDKNEQQRGNWQRWGFNLNGNNVHCQITGTARDNVNGKLRDAANSATNSIEVLGP